MTTKTLIKLGDFKFSVDTAAFSELRRVRSFNWASQQRMGQKPVLQYTGEGEESISFGGVIYPALGAGINQIETMKTMAGRGQPLLMVAGTGDVMGYWSIAQVEENRSYLFADGVPRKQEFQLSLLYYGDRYP